MDRRRLPTPTHTDVVQQPRRERTRAASRDHRAACVETPHLTHPSIHSGRTRLANAADGLTNPPRWPLFRLTSERDAPPNQHDRDL